MHRLLICSVSAVLALSGCNSTPHNDTPADKNLTVGVVQKEIKNGLPASDVAIALGSPNIVKTDPDGKEVWIYDKFTKEQVFQTNSGTLGYFSGNGGGIVSTGYDKSKVSTKTLTVVIKFDKRDTVEKVAYHTSSF
ncbi:hypothetical protein HUZ36_13025 [Pseudoalteromonas sp. McH1-7]|uniref:Lipoprotein SmpA/OmlA domain-containing protein n=1 Tax=Pseudoalteromonas peptidolytica F12-50-A1 TaxID=1315280 RepID=A0A8I0MXQ9_9GAMM|nr:MULTISPECIES: hypothetical protein [Pseudoalteromonas]MBE0346994.1 hypothetical protein [Pseudoalteromonas peptidolytica F12-50-A1]MDW7550153.1 hypothetical protein [Pseudoalteromonas peptidolytica]NLR14048.1 hypothetical protein [Pseudoalteromonas peptidolytica]NUZ11703.1 hypothetical protein [Pseudoalteromonas sp. McH1-7]RRS06535.1 hypothetical protein EAG18_21695 [Pseudoalteromonas sp. J010]